MEIPQKEITLFKCEKCDVWFRDKHTYSKHLTTDKHKMSKIEYEEKLRQHGKDAIVNGEENEKFILEVLRTFDFEDIVNQGFTANKFDIFIKSRDEQFYRGL